MDRGNNITKIAGARALADRQEFDTQLPAAERTGLMELARQFNQEHHILKRYLHMTKDDAETKRVMDKMVPRDYALINKGIYDPANRAKFWQFYSRASAEGMMQAVRNSGVHRRGINDIGRDTATQSERETRNADVHDRMSKFAANPRAPFGIDWTH